MSRNLPLFRGYAGGNSISSPAPVVFLRLRSERRCALTRQLLPRGFAKGCLPARSSTTRCRTSLSDTGPSGCVKARVERQRGALMVRMLRRPGKALTNQGPQRSTESPAGPFSVETFLWDVDIGIHDHEGACHHKLTQRRIPLGRWWVKWRVGAVFASV